MFTQCNNIGHLDTNGSPTDRRFLTFTIIQYDTL